jgi:hypothetical protein
MRQAHQKGPLITLANRHDLIREKDASLRFHPAILARTLDRWGFECGQGKRSQPLKEEDESIARRQKYLRRIKATRDNPGFPIKLDMYLDESDGNKNDRSDCIWYSGAEGRWVQKPTGTGERLLIVNAISSGGWVSGAKGVLQAKRKTGD